MSVPPPGGGIPPAAPPPGGWPPPPTGVAPGVAASQDDRTMAIVAWIGGIFVSFLVPLVIYLIKKDQSKFVAFHAMQSMAFFGATLIAYFIAGALTLVLVGFLLFPLIFILTLVYGILAALAANRGEWYEIPVVGKFARQQVGI